MLRKPHTREQTSTPERIQTATIEDERIWRLEQLIPQRTLYQATLELEQILQKRQIEEGIKQPIYDLPPEGELDQQPVEQFAHILEHAVLAVVDHNISIHQASTGRTIIVGGINQDRARLADYLPGSSNSKIPHKFRAELKLAPTIPGHLQQEYVDYILQAIERQWKEDGTLSLAEITLDQNEPLPLGISPNHPDHNKQTDQKIQEKERSEAEQIAKIREQIQN